MVDENGKIALDSKETIDALKYATELQKTMIPGTLTWNDAGNNKAYAAGQIGLTFNGVSIYYVLKNSPDPNLQAMAADTYHQDMPFGLAKRRPQSAAPMNAMLFKHSKYPNAAKEYLRFMMEADAVRPVAVQLPRLLVQSLKAYSQMKFWQADPKLAPYASAMDTPYYDGYKGPISAAVGRGDRQLHRGGHVRLGRHRQCHAGSGGKAGGKAGRALLQERLTRNDWGAADAGGAAAEGAGQSRGETWTQQSTSASDASASTASQMAG